MQEGLESILKETVIILCNYDLSSDRDPLRG